jgi:hypothetical protein
VELLGVAEVLESGDGFWRSCSGCHETEDGHDVGHYEYSTALNCTLGGGCSECGGIGAVWDNTDYGAMADAWDAAEIEREQAAEMQAPIYQVMVGDKWVDSTAAEYVAVSNEKRIVYAAIVAHTPAAQAEAVPSLLAADHQGMRVDYSGMFKQAIGALKHGGNEPGLAEMLRQLKDHLTELGQRWYAGDTAVVDELLQLYCVERDTRIALAAPASSAGDQGAGA